MSFSERIGASHIEGDFSKLDQLADALEQQMFADVGILGEAATEVREDGLTTAQIGARHELGTIDGKPPKRSFILEPLMRHRDRIDETAQSALKQAIEQQNIELLYRRLGEVGEQIVLEAFETEGDGTWQPFSENYKIRPSGAPVTSDSMLLQDTGLLKQSITSEIAHGDT